MCDIEVEVGPNVHAEKLIDGPVQFLRGIWVLPLETNYTGLVTIDAGDGAVIVSPAGRAAPAPFYVSISRYNVKGHSWRISTPWSAAAVAVFFR
jgi:hypothetical protein